MNVSSTRKVSSSSSPIKRTERHYAPGAEGHPFVEVMDTTNNVLVRDESDEYKRQQPPFARQDNEEKQGSISSGKAYVSSGAIEALSASGVYETEEPSPNYQNRQVNVYDNNQAIVEDENDNAADNPYLKHLYEKNKILEEVDEFV